MENKNNMIIWVLIVLAVVVFLVFLTINSKDSNPENTDEINSGEVEKVAENGNIVAVNYTGRLEDGTIFDSNILPEFGHVEPFVFQLGAGMVIQGWDIGILGMKIGEKKVLEIAPDQAYGETGAGDIIPPNATLVFEVELIGIINQ